MTRLITTIGGLLWLLVLQTGCTFVISGSSIDGRVVDSETGAPIAGALVIAEWSGDIGGPLHSKEVCVHLEVVVTDPEGRYHIPGWSRRPVTDWEGGFYGVRNMQVWRRTYKEGYVHVRYDPRNERNILMARQIVAPSERLDYLSHQGTLDCGRFDGSRDHEETLWRAICEEAKKLPEAAKQDRRFSGDSFLREIDAHIAHLSDEVSDKPVVDRVVVPRVCRQE